VDVGAGMERRVVAKRFEHDAVAVGQHDHGAGALDQFRHRGEARPGHGDRVGVLAKQAVDSGAIRIDRGRGAARVDAAFKTSSPGVLDKRSDRLARQV
jgi:hypothetical protein